MTTKTRSRSKPAKTHRFADWDAWSRHLASRQLPCEAWQAIPWRRLWPLRWAASDVLGASTAGLLDTLEHTTRQPLRGPRTIVDALEPWLAEAPQRRLDAGFGLECLGWAYALPRLASVLPAAPWYELLDFLKQVAQRPEEDRSIGDPLARQMVGGELPVTLGYLFPELESCRAIERRAAARVAGGLKELVDEQGLPLANSLPIARSLLACWTRCGHLFRTGGGVGWDERTWERYRHFVCRTLQCTRPDGTQILTRPPDATKDAPASSRFAACREAWTTGRRDAGPRRRSPASTAQDGSACDELFAAAIRLASDPGVEMLAEQLLSGRKSLGRWSGDFGPLTPAVHSERARTAILRPRWQRGREQLAMVYDGLSLASELSTGTETVWSGNCDPAVVVDGAPLTPVSGWRALCWFSDEDVDYLELELRYRGDWCVQRQMLLARKDRFLYLADALLGERPAQHIDYRLTLPLTEAVRYEPVEETHEGYLVGRQRLGRVLPLAVPEWRTLGADGNLVAVDGRLELRGRGCGSRLYAPLFVDLHPGRLKQPLTWRQLTVAEQLRIQSPSVAVGYRVQVGSEQWLFYRSLAAPANRTVLGQNLTAEFYAVRLGQAGGVDDLIRIECGD
jgi:hypothetical protein